MWFKNIQLYRLIEPFELSAEELHEQMLERITKPCQSLDMQTLGWDKPLGRDSELLTHTVNGCIMVCARKEEKILPSTVVRDVLNEKIAEIETNEVRTVRGKEKNQLKDEIILDLLPRAFTRSSHTFAYIDTQKNWVVVDSSSPKKAEDLLSLMGKSLGVFRVKPMEVQQSPTAILTDWLKSGVEGDFVLQEECELRHPEEEGGIVRVKHQELDGDEISVHLDAGKMVVKLAVEWNERIACILADDLSIKRLKFLDIIQDEADDAQADDYAARFDVNFSLMSLELRTFIQRLIDIYGGVNEDS